MNRPLNGRQDLPLWLKGIVVSVVILGVGLRFVDLDRKPYWIDETFTSLHISGYADTTVIEQIGQGQITSKETLQQYQFPSPDTQMWDTVQRIALTAPELPPLYFGLGRVWLQGVGHSIAAIRSLSVLVSLLALPLIYGLCLELFQSPWTGGIAITLVATSPLHFLYAQEARPYSLWITLILAAHMTLLRAVRLGTLRSWVLYGIMLTLGLYTHILFAIVALGHGFTWAGLNAISGAMDP